jgi:hypothetical protein
LTLSVQHARAMGCASTWRNAWRRPRGGFPEFAFHDELEIPGSPCGPLRLLTTRPGLECVVGLGGHAPHERGAAVPRPMACSRSTGEDLLDQ